VSRQEPRFRLPATVGALVLSLLAAAGASAQPFQVGQWQGNAFFTKDTNALTRCVIRGKPQNGVTLEFGLTASYALEIWLSSKDWRLTKGDRYPVSFWVDAGPRQAATATVATDSLVRVEVGPSDPMFDSLKRGAQLSIGMASDTKVFRLEETSRALDRLRACVDGYVRGRSATPPQSATAAPAARPPETNPFAPRGQSDLAATFADYGRWHSDMGAIGNQLLELFGALTVIDDLADRRINGQIGASEARATSRETLAKFRAEFGRISAALDRAAPYDGPYVPGRETSRTVLRHFSSVRDQLATMAVESEQTFEAAMSGDRRAHARGIVRTVDRLAALLKLENVTMELANLSLEASHPQHSLQSAVARANGAFIEILAHMKELTSGDPDGTHAAAAGAIIARMTATIVEGRGKIDPVRQTIRQAPGLRKDQLRVLDEALDTYNESFLIEERISGVSRIALSSLPDTRAQAAALGADIKPLFTKTQAALNELVTQRLALQQRRAELIAGLR
jgi:hypothetical protein